MYFASDYKNPLVKGRQAKISGKKRFNCRYLIDVPMSLVGFPNRSSKDGFVFIGFKKPTTNAKTISTMCDFDHAAISLHQTLFALLTLFIRIYIFLFFIKFAA